MNRRSSVAVLFVAAAITVTGGALAQRAGHTVSVKAASYKGTTSEHSPVTFKISGRSIRNFSTTAYYNGSCGQGGGPGFTIDAKGPIKIDKYGKFSASLTLVGPVKPVKNEKGQADRQGLGYDSHRRDRRHHQGTREHLPARL